MADDYQVPHDAREQVTLLFNTFDKDGNGTISLQELKMLLQDLDPVAWTDDVVDKLLDKSDGNNDGELQFTEFWAWIAGHGGQTAEHRSIKDDLLNHAIEEDRERFLRAKAYEHERDKAQAEKAQREADKQRKEEERAAGLRVTRKEFVDERVEIGINQRVAAKMFAQGDDDHDGELDRQELGWLASDQATTVAQIKDVFKESHESQGEDAMMEEIVNTFTAWDVDGDGSISSDELVRVIQILNPKLTLKTAEQMIKQADTNGDGSIDVREFVSWISGLNPKKKKAREIHEARMAFAMHRARSDEAKELGLQAEFEEALHQSYPSIAQSKRIQTTCGTLNKGPSPPRLCVTCKNRHAWLCHGCGFVSYYDECVNGCEFGTFGWTCLSGECKKKGDGSKKKPSFWQTKGFVQDLAMLSLGVTKIVEPPQETTNAAGAEEAVAG